MLTVSFESLSYIKEHDPNYLLFLVRNGHLETCELTFAAELIGDLPKSKPILLDLLSHPDAVVREGVLYGLSKNLDDEVKNKINYMLEDSSPAIREIVKSMLEGDLL